MNEYYLIQLMAVMIALAMGLIFLFSWTRERRADRHYRESQDQREDRKLMLAEKRLAQEVKLREEQRKQQDLDFTRRAEMEERRLEEVKAGTLGG